MIQQVAVANQQGHGVYVIILDDGDDVTTGGIG